MSENGVKAQAVSEGQRRKMLAAGLIVYAITIAGASTFELWEEYFGLSWNSLSPAFIVGLGVGLSLTLCALQSWAGLADDKPDPLTGIERELAGLRQEVAALRVHLESGAQR